MFFEIKNLCFAYYKSPLILKDVCFSIAQNSKTLLLASKDNGKTTTLKVISGFESSRFGNIYLNGKELNQIDDKDKNFSLVLSDVVLLENKTVKQNIDYLCKVLNIDELEEIQILEYYEMFETKIDLNIKVKKLSLFQKRLLQIVRSIIKNPTILFLDDQFEGLNDEEFEKMCVVYRKLLNNSNLTIFFSIEDVTYNKICKNKGFLFDKILYLNSSEVTEFSSIKAFEECYQTLDILKFKSYINLENYYIENEGSRFALLNEHEKLFIFEKQFNAKLSELKLDKEECEDCFLLNLSNIEIAEISEREFNKFIKDKKILIYSKLTGKLVI